MADYALDFGTSNTVVATWEDAGRPASVIIPDLSSPPGLTPPLVPSLVYVRDANQPSIWAGQEVLDRGLETGTDSRLFRAFKRGIGQAVTGDLPLVDGRPVTWEQVGAWFLGRLWAKLRQAKTEPVDALVLTVPVDSFETYRHWLGQVVADWPLAQVKLLDEPTAAALGYGLDQAELLLVIDFGGGTLDLALVQLTRASQRLGFLLRWGERRFDQTSGQQVETAKVVAKAGLNVGGTDIDAWLLNHFAQTENLPKNALTLRLAERLKIALSSQETATEVYFDDLELDTYELTLGRPAFESLLAEQGLLARLDRVMGHLLAQARQAGFYPQDVEAVLLVGGTSQIPAVQTWVQRYFDPQRIQAGRPLEAIAHGALRLTAGGQVQDILYHSYGIRYWDRRRNSHNWHTLIPAGQPYPMSQPVELILGASTSGQTRLELLIGELGNPSETLEVYFEEGRLVTRSTPGATSVQTLNEQDATLATLDPPGQPGNDRLRLQFWVDGSRTLRVTVQDILTGQTLITQQPVAQLA